MKDSPAYSAGKKQYQGSRTAMITKKSSMSPLKKDNRSKFRPMSREETIYKLGLLAERVDRLLRTECVELRAYGYSRWEVSDITGLELETVLSLLEE